MQTARTLPLWATALLLCVASAFLDTPAAARQVSPQDQSMHSDHADHEGMPMGTQQQTQLDAAHQRNLLADKKESEFNHHLAGFFVILAGVFILADGILTRRWCFLRLVWPSCFLLSGRSEERRVGKECRSRW